MQNSGIYKYSENIYLNLNTVKPIHLPSGMIRYPAQFIIFPVILFFAPLLFNRLVISEEGLGFLSLFFWRKVITIIHDVRPQITQQTKKESFKSFYLRFNLFLSSRLSDFIAVSTTTKNKLQKKYRNNIPSPIVIENIIGFPLITEPTKNKRLISFVTNAQLTQNPIILLYVGSDETRKNTICLANAISTMMQSNPTMFFVKLGRPIHQSNFLQLNKVLKPYQNMGRVFIGQEVDELDLAFAFSNANVFIMPSTFEGFGRTPIEAQWFGLPVISTLSSALQETIGDSAIEIQPPYKEKQIILAVEKYLKADRKLMSDKSKRNAARFSKEIILQKVHKVLG